MKLKEWCEKEGRTLRWVAKQIDMPYTTLYHCIQGLRSMNDISIDKVIKLTNGECTYEELKRKTPKKKPDA